MYTFKNKLRTQIMLYSLNNTDNAITRDVTTITDIQGKPWERLMTGNWTGMNVKLTDKHKQVIKTNKIGIIWRAQIWFHNVRDGCKCRINIKTAVIIVNKTKHSIKYASVCKKWDKTEGIITLWPADILVSIFGTKWPCKIPPKFIHNFLSNPVNTEIEKIIEMGINNASSFVR